MVTLCLCVFLSSFFFCHHKIRNIGPKIPKPHASKEYKNTHQRKTAKKKYERINKIKKNWIAATISLRISSKISVIARSRPFLETEKKRKQLNEQKKKEYPFFKRTLKRPVRKVKIFLFFYDCSVWTTEYFMRTQLKKRLILYRNIHTHKYIYKYYTIYFFRLLSRDFILFVFFMYIYTLHPGFGFHEFCCAIRLAQ